jgi:predicted permease
MQSMLQDLRYGARMLIKKPGFTLVAVLTLALGIGANTAIFSVVNAALLNPLPFTEPERVALVWNRGAEAAGGDRTPLAVADLLDWRAQNQAFESLGAFRSLLLNYTGGDVPEQVRGAGVTANFFSLLGVPVQLGRDFLPADEAVGAPRVVLLSDHFWRSRFAADPTVVGRTISLSGTPSVVIGVMPAHLDFPHKDVGLWMALQSVQPERRGPYFLTGIGRLRAGVTLTQARAEIQTMKSSFDNQRFDFNLLLINDYIVGDMRPALVALLVAVTLVLLIAAVNVANLTLAQAAGRMKEISVRSALGASRSRIIRQLLTESLLLALVGGALGALWAVWGVDLLLQLAPADLPRLDQIGIDGRVLGWTALVSLLTGVVCGLAPAWQSSRLNLNEALKEGGRGAEGDAGHRWRNLLTVTELALAVMLVVGAGLLVKSLWRLQQVETGINPERVLTMQLVLRGQRYAQPPQARDFYARLVEQTQALPGVRAAAVSNSLPPDATDYSSDFTIEGQSAAPGRLPQIAYFNHVSVDYFRALGIPLQRGRAFDAADSADAPRVLLINETFQRRFFSKEDPIGKRLNLGNEREPDWRQIVGVVGDVKYNGLADEVPPDLPNDPRTKLITARHALTHSIGWQNWRNRPTDQLNFAFNPGERFSYSGEGFFLLQRVAEQITGLGFEAFMRERVLRSLGMNRSSYIRLPEHETNLAAGHNSRGLPSEFGTAQQRQKMRELAKEWNKPMPTWRYEDVARAMAQATPELPRLPNFMSPNAAGSLLTTATEYARFMIHLMDQPPPNKANLAEATRHEMLTPQQQLNRAISWGLGIGLEIEQGSTGFWHWGDNGTYKAFTFGHPARRSGVVVLTNATTGHKLWQRVVAQVTGRDHAAFLFWMV